MKSLLLRLLTVFVALSVLVACGDEDGTNSSQPKEEQNTSSQQSKQQEQATVHITLSQDKEAEVLEEKEVEIEDGDILLEVMKENFDVVEKDGFISSIEGINDDDGTLKKAWMFYINGEMSMVGAGEVELKDGDEILFDFQSWE